METCLQGVEKNYRSMFGNYLKSDQISAFLVCVMVSQWGLRSIARRLQNPLVLKKYIYHKYFITIEY